MFYSITIVSCLIHGKGIMASVQRNNSPKFAHLLINGKELKILNKTFDPSYHPKDVEMWIALKRSQGS